MVKITEELVRKKSEHNECLISTLEELSLHQEDIERIEHLHNWCRELKILLLQSNLISKIENLFKFKKLEYLNLAINNIERIENLEGLESLAKLDLTLNFIGDLTSVESLRANYNLRDLYLTGNPCCDYPNYKQYVIATLPQLERLDCDTIKISERLKSLKKLNDNRNIIIQKQTDYAIQRDEQKIRVQQQRCELEERMASIPDEDQRIKAFWDSKSEHCPEIRHEIAKYHRAGRINDNETNMKPQKRRPPLFAPCGRPYNLNPAKLPFLFRDEDTEYILELQVYKYLDTSLIDADVNTNYIRVTIKEKIFQIALAENINISESSIQRSQITGHLMIRAPKLHAKEILKPKFKRDMKCESYFNKTSKRNQELTGTVNITNICATYDSHQLPELI